MPAANDESADLKAAVLEKAAAEGIRFVSLQFTDIMGLVKTVSIPSHKLSDAIDHGLWFDGSSVEGFARIHESDMYLQPDLTTFSAIPWDRGDNPTAKVFCDVFTPDGEPFDGDPRAVLKRQLARAREMGFIFQTGPELEFFLLRTNGPNKVEPLPHDQAGYFDVTTDLAADVRKEMVNALEDQGIVVEASHHEVAVGQHEIDFKYGPALRTADHAVTFRATLKAVAQQHNLYVTFMPKPLAGINGSGMHVHQSFSDAKTGKNLFYDSNDPYGLSKIARHFIAGLLAHAKGMIAVLAPLVNSYKRLVPGYEAPVYLSWGRTNRSALVRVPRISAGRPQATRVELRCPDPSCNPYLAFAVMLKAGLDGIRRELPLPDAAEEDLYHVDPRARGLETLPGSLGDALDELQRDELIAAALGPHIFERYVEAKALEWDEYRLHVSQWELDRYLPIY